MKALPVPAGKNILMVLGMHRSGTSAVAGTLAQLGIDFSERLVAAREDNPKGFFEHVDIWRCNQDMLEALGSQWDDTLPLPDGWQQSDVCKQGWAKIQCILQRDFSSDHIVGIKDPRMCRLMSLWRDEMLRDGFSLHIVLALRRPAEVLASLAKRDHLSPDQAAWVWLRYVLEAERATRGLPRTVVRYEKLLENWKAEMARVAERLSLDFPVNPDHAAPRIDAFLEPALQHYRGDEKPASLTEPVQSWLERTYAALTGVDEPDASALDQIGAEISSADAISASSAALLRSQRRRCLQLQDDLTRCGAEISDLDAGNASLRDNLDRHVRELELTKDGNLWLSGELSRQERELSQQGDQLSQQEERLSHVSRELDDARAEGELMSVSVAELAEALATVTGQQQQLSTELATVYASRSWQVTRPLRGAVRFQQRMFGHPSTSMATPISVVDNPPVINPVADPAAVLAATFSTATGPRILIVTPDILGPIRNGGIGTAFGALAQTLAEAGHAVTVLYTLGGHCEDGGGIDHWQHHYALLGIQFLPVWLENGEPVLDAPHHARRAYRVYLWLKKHQGAYDLAYFPEWKGEAYYALQAKRLGLDLAALRIIVVTHSSTCWAESGNYVVPQKYDDLLLEFLERRSIEMADAVISPSQYMVDWMTRRGWRWSAPTHVIQNLMPEALPAVSKSASQKSLVTEWVFFGRLERRKGLLVFLDALATMPADVRERVQVTFLGKAIRTPEFDSLEAIAGKLVGWSKPVKIIADYDRDKALNYLQQPGRVAVIASLVENSPYTVLECVLRHIPFIAADVGGIAELLDSADHSRALFTPTPASLAETLLALDGILYVAPRAAVSAATTQQRWLELQHQLLRDIPAEQVEPDAPWPHITVCLVHFNRPRLLAQAIDSLRQQTYGHFDVVLVDDGSPSLEAQGYLDGLADEFSWRKWTIVRQANAYLGAARNTAVRHARGDYVLFMDDDNIAKPHELAVFAHAARYSDADILTTVSDIFSDAGPAPQPPQVSQQLWIPLGNALGLGVFRNVFGDANALVRRSTFDSLGGFTEDYGVGHEDWEFFARACLAGANLQLVPEPLFWYRVNATSMLRAGRSQVDHARSVRPYWEGLPGDVGAALAYASHMHQHPQQLASLTTMPPSLAPSGPRWLVLLTGPFRSHVRARLMELLRTQGLRATVNRALCYIGARRNRRD